MQHQDHVNLIKNAVGETRGIWADLGSGEGAFTLALADVTEEKAEIFSVDKNSSSLETQQKLFDESFPSTLVYFFRNDFTNELNLPPLDGILMANSLHFIKYQKSFLLKIKKYLKPGGKLVLVEYNAEKGNFWVPYTIPFRKFEALAEETGFTNVQFIGSVPSRFLNEIYCAIAELGK